MIAGTVEPLHSYFQARTLVYVSLPTTQDHPPTQPNKQMNVSTTNQKATITGAECFRKVFELNQHISIAAASVHQYISNINAPLHVLKEICP